MSFQDFIEKEYKTGIFIEEDFNFENSKIKGFKFNSPVKVKHSVSIENTIDTGLYSLLIYPQKDGQSYLIILEESGSDVVQFDGLLKGMKMNQFIKVFSKLLNQRSYITEKTLALLGIAKIITEDLNTPETKIEAKSRKHYTTTSGISKQDIVKARKDTEACSTFKQVLEQGDVFDYFDYAQGLNEEATYTSQEYINMFGNLLLCIGVICKTVNERQGNLSNLKKVINILIKELQNIEM